MISVLTSESSDSNWSLENFREFFSNILLLQANLGPNVHFFQSTQIPQKLIHVVNGFGQLNDQYAPI